MKRNNIFKRSLSLLMVMIMVLGMTIMPTFAAGQLAMLTLNADDFTIVGDIGDTKSITMTNGLDSSYQKVDIEGSKVQWDSSDPTVVEITSTSSTAKTSTVNFELKKAGEVKLTASYTDPGVQSVHSNIVIEESPKGAVDGIKVKVVDEKNNRVLVAEKTFDDFDVFNLATSYEDGGFGEDFDDADVLKNNPSALHALAKVLTPKEREDADITSQGTYIQEMLGLEGEWNSETNSFWGWQYRVNGEEPDKAASIYQLENKMTIEFFYAEVPSDW